MTTPSIGDRLRRLESRAAIGELLTRYALLLDDHSFDAVGELFAADAAFGSPGNLHHGRAAIVANYRAAAELYPLSLHEVHGFVLDDLDDDAAAGTVIGYSEQASDTTSVVTSFRYADRYRRQGDRWVFAAREVSTLYAMTHTERAAGGLARPLRKRWPHREPGAAHLPIHIDDGPRPL